MIVYSAYNILGLLPKCKGKKRQESEEYHPLSDITKVPTIHHSHIIKLNQ